MKRYSLLLVLVALSVSACGGGGSSGGGSAQSANPPPPAPTGRPPSGNSLPGTRPPPPGPRDFVTFESGQVRPLALSQDGSRLFAVNTPDNRLEIFDVDAAGLTHTHSVPVGMEPVAVAEAGNGEIWVVNHLSDNISVVDVAVNPPRVMRTLWVGDEPRDIVFAGNARDRAFITTAHRGQNSPVDPSMNTGGVGRADVWVFDSNDTGITGGTAVDILTLFGDRPRALATNADGSRVYAAIFFSGNQTTSIAPSNHSKAPPHASADGVTQPDTGLILRFDGANWVDDQGQAFNNWVPFTLPDYDVFEIDATVDPPREVSRVSHVGTTLFNMVVNPVSGDIYVSNTHARNHVRFAGTGQGATTVRGHLADHRITVIENGLPNPRNLNKHIDFTRVTGTQAERDTSLSMPLGMAVTGDGSTLFVTAFGSAKVGVFDTTKLADNSFQPDRKNQIELSAGGASGIVLHETSNRGFVMTRFDNGISIVDLNTKTETDHLQMFNPEPASVIDGRPFLYDARLTSGNGNDSCGTCHIFGNTDALAWDLGDPDGAVKPIPNTFITISGPVSPFQFHPMKGPMTTQSMRGLIRHGPMHWRGDRTGDSRLTGETIEEAAFKEFNEAFVALGGRDSEISDADMQKFTNFAMQLTYPPNPIRNLDNSLTASQASGKAHYNAGIVRVQTGQLEVCMRCHPVNPAAGVFGSMGLMSDNAQTGERNMKIPHFRDQYQKVGMFGFGFQTPAVRGEQVRGFSFNHNGATSSNFIIADLGMPQNVLIEMRNFFYVFPTESPPVTGQQVTLRDDNVAEATPRIDLLIERALVTNPIPECDLIAKAVISGEPRGWLMDDAGMFVSDRANETALTRAELEALAQAPDQPLTFTCTPWGSGQRMGIDRDRDGVLDGD